MYLTLLHKFVLLLATILNDREARRIPRNECPFYSECQHALRVLSDNQPLSSKTIHRTLVSGRAYEMTMRELCVTKEEGHLLRP